ncbi:MAG: hypothetical protein ACR2PI_14585, partial [Hyphomicrobiaceae bacterium]
MRQKGQEVPQEMQEAKDVTMSLFIRPFAAAMVVLVLLTCQSLAGGQPVRFEVEFDIKKGEDGKENEESAFVIQLTKPDQIAQARKILSGQDKERQGVMGTIVKSAAPYNPNYTFHLAPDSISFFGV